MGSIGNGYKVAGDMLIKYNSDGKMEYGFHFLAYKSDNIKLTKFHQLGEKRHTTIFLPEFSDEHLKVTDGMLSVVEIFEQFPRIQREIYTEYALGAVKICSNCFDGEKKLKLIFPSGYPTMIDWGCCDRDSQLQLLLPEDSKLKCVKRQFDNGFRYENECWALVGKKDFNKELFFGALNDHYSIFDAKEGQFNFLSVETKSEKDICGL